MDNETKTIRVREQTMVGMVAHDLVKLHEKAPEALEEILKLTRTICRIMDYAFVQSGRWEANSGEKEKLYERIVRKF